MPVEKNPASATEAHNAPVTAEQKFLQDMAEGFVQDMQMAVNSMGEIVVEMQYSETGEISDTAALKKVWEAAANERGFGEQAWFKKALSSLNEIMQNYLKIKEELAALPNQLERDNTYQSKRDFYKKIREVRLIDNAVLKNKFKDVFSDLALPDALIREIQSAASSLEKFRTDGIKAVFKYPELQEFLRTISPIGKPYVPDSKHISAKFYSAVELITQLLEEERLIPSDTVKGALETIFENDELTEYMDGEISRGYALSVIRKDLMEAIQHYYEQRNEPLKKSEVIYEKLGSSNYDVNFIDFDGTLVLEKGEDENRHHIINNAVVDKINQKQSAKNIIFTQRNFQLNEIQVKKGSLPIWEGLRKLKAEHNIDIDTVSGSSDRFLGTSKSINNYGKAFRDFEVLLKDNDSDENKEKITAMIKDENQRYEEAGVKSPKGKIKQYVDAVKELQTEAPDKNINVILMDDSLDNLMEIEAYFNRMEELHQRGVVDAPIGRPKLIWIPKSEYKDKNLSPAAKLVERIIKEVAKPEDINLALQGNKDVLLKDVKALELLVKNAEISRPIKQFLMKNYSEIDQGYINNKRIITTLDFEQNLKNIKGKIEKATLKDTLGDFARALDVIEYGNANCHNQNLAKLLYKHRNDSEFITTIANSAELKERVYQIAKADPEAALTIFTAKKYTHLPESNADKQSILSALQIADLIKTHCEQPGFLNKLLMPFNLRSNIHLISLAKNDMDAFFTLMASPKLSEKIRDKNIQAIVEYYMQQEQKLPWKLVTLKLSAYDISVAEKLAKAGFGDAQYYMAKVNGDNNLLEKAADNGNNYARFDLIERFLLKDFELDKLENYLMKFSKIIESLKLSNDPELVKKIDTLLGNKGDHVVAFKDRMGRVYEQAKAEIQPKERVKNIATSDALTTANSIPEVNYKPQR